MLHVCKDFESEAPGESFDEPACCQKGSSRHGRKDTFKQENQEGRKEAKRSKEVKDEELSQEANGEVEFEETL